jgi:dipeptidyl aminopeptidase/acylaminoacyl peptidase
VTGPGAGDEHQVLPHGSWPTPITSEVVVRSARVPSGVAVDGADVWWSENRPEEGGRTALVRRQARGGGPGAPELADPVDVLPEPWNVRTGVHEYGGGAWWVRGGVCWFASWADQRLWRLAPGDAEPVALTPEPPAPRALRYADGDLHPGGQVLACVRELHPPDGAEAVNEIVVLDAHRPSEPEVVVSGPDFVADPRWSPDGARLSWLEWDHPDMPWDATRLVVRDVEAGTQQVVAGGPGESVCQPRWAPDGTLWFSSDRSGFWSLLRWDPDRGEVEVTVDLGADIGFPQWVFGQSCYAHLADGSVAFVVRRGGLDHLALRSPDGAVADLDVPHTSIDSLRARGRAVVYVAAGPTAEPHVVEVPVEAGTARAPRVLAPPRELPVGPEWFSVPEPVAFPTGGGATAHALLYRPTNPLVRAPEGERPLLLVLIHGGPTSAARPMLKLATQYWTSRGFAVVDVNYRGSTGYGRAFRELLRGEWGVADVEDCVAVVRHLADRGEVDPARCCIRGGSAGGFTTLAALAFHDVFAAGASHYGVADLEVLARDTHKFESRYLDGLVAPYPEGREVYEARSPIHHVDRIDRPLAVFQGLDDAIVPPNQAEMIVGALRDRGVPVAYVAFEGEQHGFRQAAAIRRALDAELSFYAQVLGFALPEQEAIEPVEVAGLG